MYIKVRVKADSKQETFVEKAKDTFYISVKEPTKENMANKRIVEILSGHFHTKNIHLIKGHHSPSKLFSIGIE